jgi:hypothetical protein
MRPASLVSVAFLPHLLEEGEARRHHEHGARAGPPVASNPPWACPRPPIHGAAQHRHVPLILLIVNRSRERDDRKTDRMTRVPKDLHYFFFFPDGSEGKSLRLSHYACIRSAIAKIQPDNAFFYYDREPVGLWWDQIKKIVQPVQIPAPREIFGRPVRHPAHRSDVARLEKLIERGGIYLDTDVFVHRSFDPFLGESTVIGREGNEQQQKLCNAVLVAEPHAPFLERWYQEYRDFRGSGTGLHWNEHSVVRPGLLAKEHPDEITIASNRAFFWPLFWKSDLRMIFDSTEQIVFEDTYATHLWESKAWHRYLNAMTPGEIRRRDTNFNLWARPYLEGLPDDFGDLSAQEKIGNVTGLVRQECDSLLFRIRNRVRTMAGV